MAVTPSTMQALGTQSPDFSLPDFSGTVVSRSDFAGNPLLVIFMCNHCPYVLHVIASVAQRVRDYQVKGVGVVAISANDIESYPEDAPEKMAELAKTHDFTFPYLYDESQETAKAYEAACTPDLFLYDAEHKLVYRGEYDGSRPGNDIPITGESLTAAIDALVTGGRIPEEQKPSAGCNIKWKPGNEPGFAVIG